MTAASTGHPGPRRRARRGTTRNPGPHLNKLPVGLDPKGISIAEGVRAALAASVFLVLNQWLHSVPLLIAATGALITCFCDVGGTLRQRLTMLLWFAVLGAVTWATFGLLRAAGPAFVLVASGIAIAVFSMARVWGLRAQTVGNVLIVVLALAIDAPLTPAAALTFLVFFLIGGLWACLLTVCIWRIHPDRPAVRAVAAVWAALADLAEDMRDLLIRSDTVQADWEAHARGHRRAVRAAIEAARLLVSGSIRSSGLVSGRGTQAVLMLEAADQLFGELIILSEVLETSSDPHAREQAERLLRRVRPILTVLSLATVRHTDRITASLDRIAMDHRVPGGLRDLADLIVDRLRVTVRILDGTAEMPLRAATANPEVGYWRGRVWGPLRDELTWTSAILRHAVRATILTVPAIAITLVWWTPYAHWLTITVALTMQPFFASTWQRALERIAGTVLGALIGGALAFLPQTPLAIGGALLPLSIIGFSVRQVSYGAYVACLTPMLVLLFDIAEPGHSAWMVAGMRTLYTLIGGLVAVAACMLLWPSWEPARLRRELRATMLAYARLTVAVLGDPAPHRTRSTEEARRAAGLANSNLEASLSRALQEPGRRTRPELARTIAADAILRRLGAALLAIPHDATVHDLLAGPQRQAWQSYLEGAFLAMADGRPASPVSPDAPVDSTLQRVRRGIDMLGDNLFAVSPGAAASAERPAASFQAPRASS